MLFFSLFFSFCNGYGFMGYVLGLEVGVSTGFFFSNGLVLKGLVSMGLIDCFGVSLGFCIFAVF